MRNKKRIVAIMLAVSILTINILPVNAAETSVASQKGVEVLQGDKDGEKVNFGKISKSKFLDELKKVKEEFPEADIDEQAAIKEFDLTVIEQGTKKLGYINSNFVIAPKKEYTKVKDDGTTVTLSVYSNSSWEYTNTYPGNYSGGYFTGTTCVVEHVNACTTLCVKFMVDHTRRDVYRTYGLTVYGHPDFALGLATLYNRSSGPYAEIYVAGIDLWSGIQQFYGYIVFNPATIKISTHYYYY